MGCGWITAYSDVTVFITDRLATIQNFGNRPLIAQRVTRPEGSVVSWAVWTMNGFVWLRTVCVDDWFKCARLVALSGVGDHPQPVISPTGRRSHSSRLRTEERAGMKKDELDARLSLAKVQLELDQDEVDESSYVYENER